MAIVAAFAVPHPPLIIPAVGGGRERDIQDTIDAYDEVGRRVAELAPETLVISTPHSIMYRDYIHVSPGSGAQEASLSLAPRGLPTRATTTGPSCGPCALRQTLRASPRESPGSATRRSTMRR